MSWRAGSSRCPKRTLSARVKGRSRRRRTTSRFLSMVSKTLAAIWEVDSIVTIVESLHPRSYLSVCAEGIVPSAGYGRICLFCSDGGPRCLERKHQRETALSRRNPGVLGQAPPIVGAAFHPRKKLPGEERVLLEGLDAEPRAQQRPDDIGQLVEPHVLHAREGRVARGVGSGVFLAKRLGSVEIGIQEPEIRRLQAIVEEQDDGMHL